MKRTVIARGVVTLVAIAQAGPVLASPEVMEARSAAASFLDGLAILGVILGACVLVDKIGWSFLTGQKSGADTTEEDHHPATTPRETRP